MMGQFQGVVTRLANESANTKFYRVWCGLHQLDLVLKHAYKDLWEKEVVTLMKKFIAYLRMQQLLINEMQSTCPQLTTHHSETQLTPTLNVGHDFDNAQLLKQACRQFALNNAFEFSTKRLNKSIYTITCKADNCPGDCMQH